MLAGAGAARVRERRESSMAAAEGEKEGTKFQIGSGQAPIGVVPSQRGDAEKWRENAKILASQVKLQ